MRKILVNTIAHITGKRFSRSVKVKNKSTIDELDRFARSSAIDMADYTDETNVISYDWE